jgi:hypothetical protein
VSTPSTSADLPTAVVTAGTVGLGTAATLLVGFDRSSLSPPDVGGPWGFVAAVAAGVALLTFLAVYGRRLAPPELLRRASVSLLFGLAGGTLSFALVSMLSGTFDPVSVPLWVPVVAVFLAAGSFVLVQ